MKPPPTKQSLKSKYRDLVDKLSYAVYLFICRVWYKHLLKLKNRHSSVIYYRAYITANLLFPNSTLKDNSNTANSVRLDMTELVPLTKTADKERKRSEKLRGELLSDRRIKKTLANYFLFGAYFYSKTRDSESDDNDKKKENSEINKARLYDSTVEHLSDKEAANIDKKVRKEIKYLIKECKKISSQKIEKEKLKKIEPIKIKSSSLLRYLSVSSFLFLGGSIFYVSVLLHFLGINTSDFFSIQDYASVSVDIILPTLFSVLLGTYFFLETASKELSGVIIAEQFKVKSKKKIDLFNIFVAISALTFAIHFFYGKFHASLLILPIFFCVNYVFFDYLEIHKFVKNKMSLLITFLGIIIYFISLTVNLLQTVHDVENGKYTSSYSIFFDEKYKKYIDHDFFMANSTYAFLLNKETKKIVVIPRSGIKSMRSKKDL